MAFVKVSFTDVKAGKWYTKAVEVVASKGIAQGTSTSSFNPNNNITRGEFIDWLVKALGLSARFETNFSDVSKNDYYYNSIGVAKALGITSGTGNNKCQPSKEISRQDMMVITIKALQIAEISLGDATDKELAKYADGSAISSYARNAAATMVKEGLVTGSGNNLNPKRAITRAETAQIIFNILKKYM